MRFSFIADGNAWQEFVSRLLTADSDEPRSRCKGFEPLSSDRLGDYGLDGLDCGFGTNCAGTVFQMSFPLWEPDEPLHARVNRKLTETCNKLKRNADPIRAVMGVEITRLVLIIPEDQDVKVRAHKAKLEAETGLKIEVWGRTKIAKLLSKHSNAVRDLVPSPFTADKEPTSGDSSRDQDSLALGAPMASGGVAELGVNRRRRICDANIRAFEADIASSRYISLLARRYESNDVVDLGEQMMRWIDEPSVGPTVILGDFGTGKTVFARHLSYLLSKKSVSFGGIVPLYVPLRLARRHSVHGSSFFNILQHIQDVLEYSYDLGRMDRSSVEAVLADPTTLVILDGLDELNVFGASKQECYERIRDLFSMTKRVILTCRTHYFAGDREIQELLGLETRSIFHSRLHGTPNRFDLYYLQPFSSSMIREYVGKVIGDAADEYCRRLGSTYDLAGLAAVPLFLWMISTAVPTADDFPASLEGSCALYDACQTHWLQTQAWRLHAEPDELARAVESMAAELASADDPVRMLTRTAIQRLLRSEFPHAVRRVGLSLLEEDIRTCTFLVGDEGGDLRFVHRSFEEYFLARYIARVLHVGHSMNAETSRGILPDDARAPGRLVEVLHPRMLSDETLFFFFSIARSQDPSLDHPRSGPRRCTQMQLSSQGSYAPSVLWDLVRQTQGRPVNAAGFVGSNAVTLLNYLGSDLASRPLQAAVLDGADLSGASMENADCSRASLRGVRLACGLRNAQFVGADLSDAIVPNGYCTRDLAFFPDESAVAVAVRSFGAVQIASLRDKSQRHFPGYVNWRSHPESVCVCPARGGLIGIGFFGTWAVCELQSGKLAFQVTDWEGQQWINAMQASPDGRLWVADLFGDVMVYDAELGCKRYEKHVGSCAWPHFAMSPSGRFFAAADIGGKVTVYRVEDGEVVDSFARKAGRGNETVHLSLHPSEDLLLVSCTETREVLLRDFGRHQFEVFPCDVPHGATLDLSPCGRMVSMEGVPGGITVCDLTSGSSVQMPGGGAWILRWSPSGRFLAAVGRGASVRVWETRSGREVLHLDYAHDCRGMALTKARGLDTKLDRGGCYDGTTVGGYFASRGAHC